MPPLLLWLWDMVHFNLLTTERTAGRTKGLLKYPIVKDMMAHKVRTPTTNLIERLIPQNAPFDDEEATRSRFSGHKATAILAAKWCMTVTNCRKHICIVLCFSMLLLFSQEGFHQHQKKYVNFPLCRWSVASTGMSALVIVIVEAEAEAL